MGPNDASSRLAYVWYVLFFIFSFHFITNLNHLFYSHPQQMQTQTLGLRMQEMVEMGPNDASRCLAYGMSYLFIFFITNICYLFYSHPQRTQKRTPGLRVQETVGMGPNDASCHLAYGTTLRSNNGKDKKKRKRCWKHAQTMA